MQIYPHRPSRNSFLFLVLSLVIGAGNPLLANEPAGELSAAWRLLEEAAADLTTDSAQAERKMDEAARIYRRLESSTKDQDAREARLVGEAGLWFLRARMAMDTDPDAAATSCDEALRRTRSLEDTLGSYLVVSLQADGESSRGRHERAIRRLRQAEAILLEHEQAELPPPLRSDLVLLLLIWDECPHRDFWRSLDNIAAFEGFVLRALRVATRQWLAEELDKVGQRDEAIQVLESTLGLVPDGFPNMQDIQRRLEQWRAGS